MKSSQLRITGEFSKTNLLLQNYATFKACLKILNSVLSERN